MAVNGMIFGLAYKQFDESKEYYYLRAILKVRFTKVVILKFKKFLMLECIWIFAW